MLERLNKEFRRRSKAIGVFPTINSCLKLFTLYAIKYADSWEESRLLRGQSRRKSKQNYLHYRSGPLRRYWQSQYAPAPARLLSYAAHKYTRDSMILSHHPSIPILAIHSKYAAFVGVREQAPHLKINFHPIPTSSHKTMAAHQSDQGFAH